MASSMPREGKLGLIGEDLAVLVDDADENDDALLVVEIRRSLPRPLMPLLLFLYRAAK